MKFNRRTIFPIVLVFIGTFLIIGSVFWTVKSEMPQTANLEGSSVSNLPYPDVARVNLVEAKAAFENSTAIFLDVRGEPYYSQGHIPGAISTSEEELLDHLGELDQSAWIITYCT